MDLRVTLVALLYYVLLVGRLTRLTTFDQSWNSRAKMEVAVSRVRFVLFFLFVFYIKQFTDIIM